MIPVLLETFVAEQSVIILLTFLIVAHELHSLAVQQAWFYLELGGPVEIGHDYFLGFRLAAQEGH